MSRAQELTRQHGGTWFGFGRYGLIPTPGHSRSDRGTMLSERGPNGVHVECFNGDQAAVIRALGLDDEPAAPLSKEQRRTFAEQRLREQQEKTARALGLWAPATPPEPGGPVRNYLASRGIPPALAAKAIANGAIRELRERQGVSMVALSRDSDGAARAVQKTKLLPDGSGKAEGQYQRLTFGSPRGCAVRLLAPHDGQLAIAEGVESALAFYALHRIPAWAALGTAFVSLFKPPPGIKRLYLATDGDAAGRACAADLYKRLEGIVDCELAIAPEGQDWNDVMLAKAGERARR